AKLHKPVPVSFSLPLASLPASRARLHLTWRAHSTPLSSLDNCLPALHHHHHQPTGSLGLNGSLSPVSIHNRAASPSPSSSLLLVSVSVRCLPFPTPPLGASSGDQHPPCVGHPSPRLVE